MNPAILALAGGALALAQDERARRDLLLLAGIGAAFYFLSGRALRDAIPTPRDAAAGAADAAAALLLLPYETGRRIGGRINER